MVNPSVKPQESAFIHGSQQMLPRGWGQLFSPLLASYSQGMRGAEITIFAASCPLSPIRGEVWRLVPDTTTPILSLTSGCLQMLVTGGDIEAQKNGRALFVRDGERISFVTGDSFSLTVFGKGVMVLTKNEAATFGELATLPPAAPVSQISEASVELCRGLLGISGKSKTIPPPGEGTSAGYRGKHKYANLY